MKYVRLQAQHFQSMCSLAAILPSLANYRVGRTETDRR
jgi:hypothetical protein